MQKVALTTGASSGIGAATAARLAKADYKVFGTSRRTAPAGQRPCEMLTLDATSDESAAVLEREYIGTATVLGVRLQRML